MASLAEDLAASLDPVLLARSVLGMECDPWQADLLRSTHRQELVVCSRQTGKSTTASVAAVHTAIYQPGSLVVLVSPSQRQSGEVFRKCTTLYRAMGRPVAPEAENALSLVLESGSRILSLPGDEKTVRGLSAVDLLIIDEAARVSDSLLAAVRPMLAISRGRLLALSTPWGQRGWFYRASLPESGWRVTRVRADDCPRITTEFLAQERSSLGDVAYRSEYLAEFVSAAGSMFDADDIAALFAVGGDDAGPIFDVQARPSRRALPAPSLDLSGSEPPAPDHWEPGGRLPRRRSLFWADVPEATRPQLDWKMR